MQQLWDPWQSGTCYFGGNFGWMFFGQFRPFLAEEPLRKQEAAVMLWYILCQLQVYQVYGQKVPLTGIHHQMGTRVYVTQKRKWPCIRAKNIWTRSPQWQPLRLNDALNLIPGDFRSRLRLRKKPQPGYWESMKTQRRFEKIMFHLRKK